MGQRGRTLAQVFGFDGFKLAVHFETRTGTRLADDSPASSLRECTLVLSVTRRWLPRCGGCGRACPKQHCQLPARRWSDLPWSGHPVVIAYAPVRVRCVQCQSTAVEMIAWADAKQRQTRRLQQHIAVQAMSMPTSHVAALNALDWSTVQRCTDDAIARWLATRNDRPPLTHVGVDEKYLGRRAKNRKDKFVTIVSDLKTGEPVWIGPGRRVETLASWLSTLSAVQKAALRVFAMDMHEPFAEAIRNDPALEHVAIAHDPFHLMKRVGEAVDEVRRQQLFRAGPQQRALGRGTRWLYLRAADTLTAEQHDALAQILKGNRKLMLAYTVKEQMRDVLRSSGDDILLNLDALMRRIVRRDNEPMRKLYESLRNHMPGIRALAEHRPPTGRIEALNNNWETLVRRGRGYRDLSRLLNYLRFTTINPIRHTDGIDPFLALAA